MCSEIDRLRELCRLEGVPLSAHSITSGCLPLDRLLPQRGFSPGSLVEWLAEGPGSGASLLALLAARAACREAGALVIVDRSRSFYPPAGAACRVDLQSAIVVHPPNEKDECWALDQALRCPQVAAAVAWPERIAGRTFRRLQLAAEQGGGMGFLVRPAGARSERSWANVRLLVSPRASRRGWRLGVELLRCGGCFERSVIELEIDEETSEIRDAHPGDLAPPLAGAALDSRQARA